MSNVSYISTNVENGLTFDDLVGNLLAYKPANWGYTEQDYSRIALDFGVASNSLYYLPEGNYKIHNIPGFPVAASFVNAAVFLQKDGSKRIICNYGGRERYSTVLTSAADSVVWTDITNTSNDGGEILLLEIGDTHPTNTSLMWVDTSKFAATGEVYLRHYNGSAWVSYTDSSIMLQNVYDPKGIKKDPYDMVAAKISEFITKNTTFVHHKNNEFTLMHLTQDERERHNTYMLTTDTVAAYFATNSELYNHLVEVIVATSAAEINFEDSQTAYTEITTDLTQHTTGHITEEDAAAWDAKAPKDHTHNKDSKVTITVDQIGGDKTFSLDQLPEDIKERINTVANSDAMYALTASQVHVGDYVYVEAEHLLYRVINTTVLGTADKASGFKKLMGVETSFPFNTVNNTPTTLAGYGITDGVLVSEYEELAEAASTLGEYFQYTPVGFDVDTLRQNGSIPQMYIGVQKTLSANGGGTPSYPMSTPTSDLDILLAVNTAGDMYSGSVYKFNAKITNHWWDRATISETPREWSEIRYGNGVYVAITLDSSVVAYSTDCKTWHEATISDTPREWWSLCYGGDKFVIIAKYSNVVACSSDGKTWTEYTVSNTERAWWSICYGNGKYVMTESGSNVFAYSTNGTSWTEVTVGNVDRYWYSVCYGNGKYVAIAAGDDASAYSTDGIHWTVTDIIDSRQDWHAVCYGNGKYVAIACI